MPRFSVIMPAFRAGNTIAATIRSLLAQTEKGWEAMVISDDGTDYGALLARDGVTDPRIRHVTTGAAGTGSSNARNVGLDAASADFIAILDADDLMTPDKLAIMAEALKTAPLVSTGLSVTDSGGRELRTVGVGPDRMLNAADYKFTNFSMDSMIGYDRRQGDPRYDVTLPCLTDLDLILKLFATRSSCFHLGRKLHCYVKQPVSISNGPGASARIAQTKVEMLQRLKDGHYPMQDAAGPSGFSRFLEISLQAERAYEKALETDPALLFEDHIAPLLKASSTA